MSQSTDKRYGIAICGLGRAGSIHTGNCVRHPKVDIKYFVELDLSRAEQVKKEYGLVGTKVVHSNDFNTVLEDPDVDGVIIATVTYAHEEYVKKCIQAKKPTFCEKPIAENLKDTVSCYEEAERLGVPLFCAFNRRFDATHRAVKDAVDNGEVGEVHMIKVCSRDSPIPSAAYLKISGGIYHDCAVHDIDMATWIMKDYPTTVFSQAHAFRKFIKDLNDVDTVSITMQFASGAIAQIDLSRFAAYGYDQRVEVLGELGMVESLNENKTNLRKSTGQSISNDLLKFSFPQRYPLAYEKEIHHFLDIIDGTPPLITKTDVSMVSLIASACEESHRTGKQVRICKDTLTYEVM